MLRIDAAQCEMYVHSASSWYTCPALFLHSSGPPSALSRSTSTGYIDSYMQLEDSLSLWVWLWCVCLSASRPVLERKKMKNDG